MPADNLPIGTILIWAGDPGDLPATWKVCNGKQLKKTDYPDLYGTLGTRWDNDLGYQADFFSIPDLRGVFLRGVNDDRNDGFQDKNVAQRIRLKGNSTISMDDAGSYQKDSIGKHNHEIVNQTFGGKTSRPLAVSGNVSPADGDLDGSGNVTGYDKHSVPLIIDNYGIEETRPVNAYVYYIIKVKNL